MKVSDYKDVRLSINCCSFVTSGAIRFSALSFSLYVSFCILSEDTDSYHDDHLVTGPPILPCCVDACNSQDAFTFPAVIDDVAVVVCCQDVGGDCVGGVRRGGSEGMSHFDCFFFFLFIMFTLHYNPSPLLCYCTVPFDFLLLRPLLPRCYGG